MIQKLRSYIGVLGVFVVLVVGGAATVPITVGADDGRQIDACSINSSSSLCNNPVSSPTTVVKVVISFLMWLIGIVSVFMMIYAGILFVTSGGGDGVKRAKTTMIWAAAGLAIAVFAFAIVNFVIDRIML